MYCWSVCGSLCTSVNMLHFEYLLRITGPILTKPMEWAIQFGSNEGLGPLRGEIARKN